MILKKINGTLIRKCKVNDQYTCPCNGTTSAQLDLPKVESGPASP